MFGGGFSKIPRKPNEPQKPLGVIQEGAPITPPQKPLGVLATPAAAPQVRQGPLGVIPSPGQVSFPPDAPGGHLKASQVEAEWDGVIFGWSGYAKAGRSIIRRASVFSKIRIADGALWDPNEPDPDIRSLYQFHRSIQVSQKAPLVRFFGPQPEARPSYRVIYTMMETERVHPSMISLMNQYYDECWVPTHWNAGTFRSSGLRIPMHVMPLGVDPGIYSPSVQPALPKATLMTGKDAGRLEVPSGFLFISVFNSSFRKGYDVLIKTFEEAFARDPGVGLILGTTYSNSLPKEFPWKSMSSRIWVLNGTYSDLDLASTYKACQVYVCTSRGEGFNMPVTEAAAVGIPVIVPRTSAHPEIVPEGMGYFFEKDSDRLFPEGNAISPWYEGIVFPDYGPKSCRQFADLMKHARKNYAEALGRAQKLRAHIIGKYTWSLCAKKVASRIREICGR